MKLTSLRIVLLSICTLVFSILGVALIVIGVHGPEVVATIGGFFLLPCILLTRLGVPVGIPFLQSMSIVSVLIFVVLQTAYYYCLLQLFYLLFRRRRKAAGINAK